MTLPVDEHALRAAAALLRDVSAGRAPSLTARADALVLAEYLEGVVEGVSVPTDAGPGRSYAAAGEVTSAAPPAGPAEVDGAMRGGRSSRDEIQHAVASGGGSLCGLPADALVVYRHHFVPGRLDSCPACRSLAVPPT